MKLNIQGESDKETEIINSLNYLKVHSDYLGISSEVDSVQNALFRTGYIENKLDSIKKLNDSIFEATLHLGRKIDTIYIYYQKNEVDKDFLNAISTKVEEDYFVIPIDETEKALNFINSKIAEKGLPFATLKLTNIEIKDSISLKSQLAINLEGKKRNIDKIIIKSYDAFPKTYIKHYLKIRPKEIFDLNGIKRQTKLLKNLKFANEIKPPEVLFTPDSTTLYLYIEKRRSNSFDGFLGFGTNENSGKLELSGYLNLNLNNNLNYGESFNLIYRSDQNEQKMFNAKLNLPYLFGSPLGTEMELNIFKRDSTYTTVNQKVRLFHQINSKSTVFLGVSSTQSNNLLPQDSVEEINDYDAVQFSMAYQFISSQTDNILFPFNSSLFVETGVGKRKISSVSEKQSKLEIDAFKIFNLNQGNSVYIRINGISLFSDNYLENELLHFGGINSIRGFEENSLLGSLFGIINSEYRLQINTGLYIHSITDFGYFENKLASQKEKLYGFGFGFGLMTKAGLLRFNYANGKNEDQKFKFSNSKIHISLIANF